MVLIKILFFYQSYQVMRFTVTELLSSTALSWPFLNANVCTVCDNGLLWDSVNISSELSLVSGVVIFFHIFGTTAEAKSFWIGRVALKRAKL